MKTSHILYLVVMPGFSIGQQQNSMNDQLKNQETGLIDCIYIYCGTLSVQSVRPVS